MPSGTSPALVISWWRDHSAREMAKASRWQMFEIGKKYMIWVWDMKTSGMAVTGHGPARVVEVMPPLIRVVVAPQRGGIQGWESIINTSSPAFVRAEPIEEGSG